MKKYLFLLENTFIVTLLRPYHGNSRKELTKMPKIFYNDVGLRNIVRGAIHIPQQDEGALFENFVFSELKKRFIPNESLFFWRTTNGSEVDFVIRREGKIFPVEVKSLTLRRPAVSRSLSSFIASFQPETAVVVNRNFSHCEKINGTRVAFLPAYAL